MNKLDQDDVRNIIATISLFLPDMLSDMSRDYISNSYNMDIWSVAIKRLLIIDTSGTADYANAHAFL